MHGDERSGPSKTAHSIIFVAKTEIEIDKSACRTLIDGTNVPSANKVFALCWGETSTCRRYHKWPHEYWQWIGENLFFFWYVRLISITQVGCKNYENNFVRDARFMGWQYHNNASWGFILKQFLVKNGVSIRQTTYPSDVSRCLNVSSKSKETDEYESNLNVDRNLLTVVSVESWWVFSAGGCDTIFGVPGERDLGDSKHWILPKTLSP